MFSSKTYSGWYSMYIVRTKYVKPISKHRSYLFLLQLIFILTEYFFSEYLGTWLRLFRTWALSLCFSISVRYFCTGIHCNWYWYLSHQVTKIKLLSPNGAFKKVGCFFSFFLSFTSGELSLSMVFLESAIPALHHLSLIASLLRLLSETRIKEIQWKK